MSKLYTKLLSKLMIAAVRLSSNTLQEEAVKLITSQALAPLLKKGVMEETKIRRIGFVQ